MAYTFELEMMVIGRHMLGFHKTCVHETFGTVRSIFTTTGSYFENPSHMVRDKITMVFSMMVEFMLSVETTL